MAALSR